MNVWLIFLAIFAGILSMCVIIIIIISKMSKTDDGEVMNYEELLGDNPNIVLNFMPDECEGHAILWESYSTANELGLSSKSSNVCFPRDIQVMRDGLKMKGTDRMKKNYRLLVDANCRVVLPKGTLSKWRNIVLYLPKRPEELPQEFRNTPIGFGVEYFLRQNEILQPLIEMYRESAENKDSIMRTLNTGELSRQLLDVFGQINQHVIQTTMKEQMQMIDASRGLQQPKEQRREQT